MKKWLLKFGLAKPKRLEMMALIVLAFLMPFAYSINQSGVLGVSTQTKFTTTSVERSPFPRPSIKPSQAPIPFIACKQGTVEKFAVATRCGENSYRRYSYTCGDNSNSALLGSNTTCKSISAWYETARKNCAVKCPKGSPNPSNKTAPTSTHVTPTPYPTPTATPTNPNQLILNGSIFVDYNKNGEYDTSDGVYLYGAKISVANQSNPSTIIKTVTSGSSNGVYSIDGLSRGNYILSLEVPDGYTAGTAANVNINSDQHDRLLINFGIVKQ